jgi:transposase
MKAAEMFARGKRQVDVVTELGVPAQTASRWYRVWADGGRAALGGAGRAGRARKLSDAQLAEVEAALAKGPRAYGFATEMWTLARVAEVIVAVTRVRYSQTQTSTVLRERLLWGRQRPARRAMECDDEADRHLGQGGLAIQARGAAAWIVFQDLCRRGKYVDPPAGGRPDGLIVAGFSSSVWVAASA